MGMFISPEGFKIEGNVYSTIHHYIDKNFKCYANRIGGPREFPNDDLLLYTIVTEYGRLTDCPENKEYVGWGYSIIRIFDSQSKINLNDSLSKNGWSVSFTMLQNSFSRSFNQIRFLVKSPLNEVHEWTKGDSYLKEITEVIKEIHELISNYSAVSYPKRLEGNKAAQKLYLENLRLKEQLVVLKAKNKKLEQIKQRLSQI